ncbi:MAG: zinc ABC transporter substrate-binding protein [Endomicrobiaceae bacterium]|nr:zinc ABC transporter substrate-binding protein [Endomicrobiaceae bacterium]
MKFRFVSFLICFCLLFSTITFAGERKKLKVAVTTSHLSSLMQEICQDKIDVITILEPTTCPSNNDIDAKKIKEISTSNIVLYHIWQPWAKDLKYKIANLEILYKEFKTEGNLMIPYINIRGAEEIKNIFSVLDAENKQTYESNFIKYVFKINQLSEEIIRNNGNNYNKKIACNYMISDFMKWLGFNVVATYPKSDKILSSDMANLIRKIKKANAVCVVDNLQLGTDVGRILNKDLKIRNTVISNFPLGNSYIHTLKDNIAKIDKVINQ